MSYMSGFLAGAGEQLVSVADRRLKQYGAEDLLAAQQEAEIAKEKRIEEAAIRGEGRAEAADTRRRGLINAERRTEKEADFKFENDPNNVATKASTAKTLAAAKAESDLAADQAKIRAMATPEMLALERKISDAKESSATRAAAAATWFKLGNDKKTVALQDAYTNAKTPEEKAQAKAKLDAHYEAATPRSSKDYATVLKETGDRLKDVERALETNPDDQNLLRERAGLVSTFNAVQGEMTKGVNGGAAANPAGSAPKNAWNDATGEVISNGKVIGTAKSPAEAKALIAKLASSQEQNRITKNNVAPQTQGTATPRKPQKTPEVSGAYAAEINATNRAIDQLVSQSQEPGLSVEQRVKFSEQIGALQKQLKSYEQKAGR